MGGMGDQRGGGGNMLKLAKKVKVNSCYVCSQFHYDQWIRRTQGNFRVKFQQSVDFHNRVIESVCSEYRQKVRFLQRELNGHQIILDDSISKNYFSSSSTRGSLKYKEKVSYTVGRK